MMKKIKELEELLKNDNRKEHTLESFLRDYRDSVNNGMKFLDLYHSDLEDSINGRKDANAGLIDLLRRYDIQKFSISKTSFALLAALVELEQAGYRVCGAIMVPNHNYECAKLGLHSLPAVVLKYVGKKEI